MAGMYGCFKGKNSDSAAMASGPPDLTNNRETEEIQEECSGKKKSKFQTFKKFFARKKRKDSTASEVEAGLKACQSSDNVSKTSENNTLTRSEREKGSGSKISLGSKALSHDSVFVSDSSEANEALGASQDSIHGKVKSLQLQLKQAIKLGSPPSLMCVKRTDDAGTMSEDDGLPCSPPEYTALHTAMGQAQRNSSISLEGMDSDDEQLSCSASSRAVSPLVVPGDFSQPASPFVCLDNSAARHKLGLRHKACNKRKPATRPEGRSEGDSVLEETVTTFTQEAETLEDQVNIDVNSDLLITKVEKEEEEEEEEEDKEPQHSRSLLLRDKEEGEDEMEAEQEVSLDVDSSCPPESSISGEQEVKEVEEEEEEEEEETPDLQPMASSELSSRASSLDSPSSSPEPPAGCTEYLLDPNEQENQNEGDCTSGGEESYEVLTNKEEEESSFLQEVLSSLKTPLTPCALDLETEGVVLEMREEVQEKEDVEPEVKEKEEMEHDSFQAASSPSNQVAEEEEENNATVSRNEEEEEMVVEELQDEVEEAEEEQVQLDKEEEEEEATVEVKPADGRIPSPGERIVQMGQEESEGEEYEEEEKKELSTEERREEDMDEMMEVKAMERREAEEVESGTPEEDEDGDAIYGTKLKHDGETPMDLLDLEAKNLDQCSEEEQVDEIQLAEESLEVEAAEANQSDAGQTKQDPEQEDLDRALNSEMELMEKDASEAAEEASAPPKPSLSLPVSPEETPPPVSSPSKTSTLQINLLSPSTEKAPPSLQLSPSAPGGSQSIATSPSGEPTAPTAAGLKDQAGTQEEELPSQDETLREPPCKSGQNKVRFTIVPAWQRSQSLTPPPSPPPCAPSPGDESVAPASEEEPVAELASPTSVEVEPVLNTSRARSAGSITAKPPSNATPAPVKPSASNPASTEESSVIVEGNPDNPFGVRLRKTSALFRFSSEEENLESDTASPSPTKADPLQPVNVKPFACPPVSTKPALPKKPEVHGDSGSKLKRVSEPAAGRGLCAGSDSPSWISVAKQKQKIYKENSLEEITVKKEDQERKASLPTYVSSAASREHGNTTVTLVETAKPSAFAEKETKKAFSPPTPVPPQLAKSQPLPSPVAPKPMAPPSTAQRSLPSSAPLPATQKTPSCTSPPPLFKHSTPVTSTPFSSRTTLEKPALRAAATSVQPASPQRGLPPPALPQDEPPWMALAKKKAKAWSEMPQIVQ